MAGEFARSIKARNLLLTHFSNRYGTANTRSGGEDGSGSSGSSGSSRSESKSNRRKKHLGSEEDVDDDMALPEEAPEDMRAAAQEEISLVEGLVRGVRREGRRARRRRVGFLLLQHPTTREFRRVRSRQGKPRRHLRGTVRRAAPRDDGGRETKIRRRRRGYGGGYGGRIPKRAGTRGGYQNARGRGGYAQGNVRGGERVRGFERNADGSFRRRAAGAGAARRQSSARGERDSHLRRGTRRRGGASGSGSGSKSSGGGDGRRRWDSTRTQPPSIRARSFGISSVGVGNGDGEGRASEKRRRVARL